ncbi:hypothetical protein [Zavarzinella formosa]|uniref:hypothetical protein n=1 Tax=Zavarzinella formosa TaxID=360055 RepID=UPI000308E53C|nr:hypothetical protein [Zavarzinella formosa]
MADLAEQIAHSAAKVVASGESRNGSELDYSEASLAAVEAMLAEAAEFAGEMTPAHLTTLAQDIGCYILEVGRRSFGGRYLWHDQRDQPVLVVGEPIFRVAILAWNKVRGRLGGDTGDNIPFFYAGFAERVRSASPGTDALYV